MLFKEIIAVYSVNLMKPIKTFCWENVELLVIKAVVRIVTTGILKVNPEERASGSY
jgi:hypothetical protein